VGLPWPGPVSQDRADKVLLEALESGIRGVECHPPGLAVPAIARQRIEQRKLGSLMLLEEACVLSGQAFVADG